MTGMAPIDSPSIDEDSSGGSSRGISDGGEGGGLKKGPWTSAEDAILVEYVRIHGEGNWNAVQKSTGLSRCGKSCRLRWANHLRPNLKKGAFTAEEEQMIIELHARMGNKWARMATQLPGRTDNEIKNYWNTRIKRHQRAGLPLYPPSLCLQSSGKIQSSQNPGDFSCGYKRHCNYSSQMAWEKNLGDNKECFSVAETIPVTALHNLLNLGSQQLCFENTERVQTKRLRSSEALLPNFNLNVKSAPLSFEQLVNTHSVGYPSDFRKVASVEGDIILGSHASNGAISASRPPPGAMKSELPSLQYPEMDLCSWILYPPTNYLEADGTRVQSPRTSVSQKSSCVSLSNKVMKELLLHEANSSPSAGQFESSEFRSNSSSFLPCEMQHIEKTELHDVNWAEIGDPVSPLGHSAASVFGGNTTPLSSSCLDGLPPSKPVSGGEPSTGTVQPIWIPIGGQGGSPHPDFARPDALLDSDWLENSSESASDSSVLKMALETFLGEDFFMEQNPLLCSSNA